MAKVFVIDVWSQEQIDELLPGDAFLVLMHLIQLLLDEEEKLRLGVLDAAVEKQRKDGRFADALSFG